LKAKETVADSVLSMDMGDICRQPSHNLAIRSVKTNVPKYGQDINL